MKQDGRRDLRQPISLKVRFKSATLSDFIEKHAGDVSRGGIFIKTKKPMPVGTLLKFEFKLKDDQNLINGVGRVVWARTEAASENEPPGMGIKFIKLDEESHTRIDEIVDGAGSPAGMNIDEPFGEETAASFPRALLEEQLAAQQSKDTSETTDVSEASAGESQEKVAPPPAREKPPIAIPVPAPRGSRTSLDPDSKRTMLGMAAASPPAGEEQPAVPVPSSKTDRQSATILGIPGVVPVPTSAQGEEPDGDLSESAGEPADIGFKPGPEGVRESGILKDISTAIDSALTRRAADAGTARAPEPEKVDTPPAEVEEGEVAEADHQGSAMEDEDVDQARETLSQSAVTVPPDGAAPPAGPVPAQFPEDEEEEEEEEEEDDIRAHEAVVISEPPARTSMAPSMPVVEATRAGAGEKSPGGQSYLGLIVAVILVLALGGAAAWWFLVRGGTVDDLKSMVSGAKVESPAPVVVQPVAKPVAPAAAPEPQVKQPTAPAPAPIAVETMDLQVTTEPAGARLLVNGEREKNVTPLSLSGVTVGRELELTASLFGYLSETVRVAPTAEEPQVQIALGPAQRQLRLEGTPPGASVYVNGKPAGRLGTTATIEEIGPGLSYMVRKTGYATRRGKLGPMNWREKDGVWIATIRVDLEKSTTVPAAKPSAPKAVEPEPAAAPKPKPKPVEPAPAPEKPKPAEPAAAPEPKPAEPAPAPKPPAPKKKPAQKKKAPAKPAPADSIDENPF